MTVDIYCDGGHIRTLYGVADYREAFEVWMLSQGYTLRETDEHLARNFVAEPFGSHNRFAMLQISHYVYRAFARV